MSIWIKTIALKDSKGNNITGKIENEIKILKILNKYDFVPKFISTEITDEYYHIKMQNLNSACVADKYGEEPEDIPIKYLIEMKNIIKKLFYEEKIEYIDITPYNFIEKNDKIYLIDFEHAYLTPSNNQIPKNWFLREIFSDNSETIKFNPDFK
jgi:tRNA A-37 threonylcarbamoyl transferase component Bud32